MSSWILLAALGAVAAIDSAALFQGMLHQPLVICTILGSALGLPIEGAYFGALLQLLWLKRLPVGVSIYPDIGPVAVGSAGGALIAFESGLMDMGIAGIAVLLTTIIFVRMGGRLMVLQREAQGGFIPRVEDAIKAGRPGRIRLMLLEGIAMSATRGIIMSVAAAGFLLLLLTGLRALPLENVIQPYTLLAGVLGLGVGSVLELFDRRELLPWVAVGVVVGVITMVMI
ncbi:PTS sugar transporter subunit IIC [Gemmatimonadota bacterium]